MPTSEQIPDVDASTLRIALFTDTYLPQVNGVTRTLARLSDAVRERGGEVRVFTVTDPDTTPDSQVIRFRSTPFWAYKELRLAWPSSKQLRVQLNAFRPNLVHLATPFGIGLAGRRLAKEMNVPMVSSYHTSFAAYARHYKMGAITGVAWRFLRWFHNSTMRTYCPTQSIVEEIRGHGFRNTAVWSRGVDTALFSPKHRSSALRATMGADSDSLVVTYVGRLAAEKGLDTATAALRIADAQRPGKIVFSCVGDGPYADEVRRSSPQRSWLPGKLSGQRLSEAYASGDVFLFPSTTDTFGNVILEAMASGLPVVGADVGPTRELVDSERGWLAKAGDANAFARILVELIDNRAAVLERRRAVLQFAKDSNWDGIWSKLIGDYLRVVKT